MTIQNQLIESPTINLVGILKDFYDKKNLPNGFGLLTSLMPPYKVDQIRYAFDFDHLFEQTNEVAIYSSSST